MDFADKASIEAAQTKDRQSAQLVKKFSALTKAIASGSTEEVIQTAYNEVMSDCDELALLSRRVPYIAMANAIDVQNTISNIEGMKAQASKIEADLTELLKELEVRSQVASLISLPTREALQLTYETQLERELKPIEIQKALVAQKVALHRKHLGVLWAAIQQMEAEIETDHQFTLSQIEKSHATMTNSES